VRAQNPNKIVAVNVRRLRARHKISQEKLADLSGIHRTYIGAVERGERNVTLGTLQRIADALGVSCADLLVAREGRGK